MSREEFLKWLDTCPSHKYEIIYDDDNGISVNFRKEWMEKQKEMAHLWVLKEEEEKNV
jgi:hypothetical protein